MVDLVMCIDFASRKLGCDEASTSPISDWIDGWVMCVGILVICAVYAVADHFSDHFSIWNRTISSC